MQESHMYEPILKQKCAEIADKISLLCRQLKSKDKEYIITDQLSRSIMSIGANYAEACFAQSRSVFLNRLNISRRECAESQYWLERLHNQKMINSDLYLKLNNQLTEILKLLNASCATAKRNQKY